MAAYAALVSVMHIIEQIQNHPRPPISLDKEQVEYLTEKVGFLQDYLENYSINGGGRDDADGLESRIADAVYAAEDLIESHIVDQIQAASTSTHGKIFTFINFFRGLCKARSTHGEKISSIDLYDGLQKVIQDLDLIKRDVTAEITKKMETQDDQLLLQRNSSTSAGSLRISSSSLGHNTTVGLDDILIEIMDKLTGDQSNRQIIPIVGMGGIGKTTLARSVYANPLIVQYFDFRGWATISQEYNSKEILSEVLLCLKIIGSRESFGQMSEQELGNKLYKSLFGRRYLIVMDDIWSIEAWDKVKTFFPNNNDGSAIMLTTRLSNLAFQLNDSGVLKMSFLDEDKSWYLFCKSAFGEEGCPLELEEIGKKIAKNCKGLPLSVVVIGGLLAKSKRTREHWQYIAENLNSILNLEDNEHCLRILRLSYNHLPVHLKPCFLYMGMFPEDHEIHVSTLIKLWVAEGFLKPISGKSLEVAAEEYLKDLIDRNLILIHELGSTGKIKRCTIHDLLRDLCLKEAEKDKFFHVAETHGLNIGQSWHTERRIGIHGSTSKRKYIPRVLRNAVQSASLARSLICYNIKGVVAALPFRLLRVLNTNDISIFYFEYTTSHVYSLKDVFQLANLRHLAIVAKVPKLGFSSSVYHQLWNLQTLCISTSLNLISIVKIDIWKMPQLRHVKSIELHLPNPPTDDHDFVVLENLQTLQTVYKFKCGEEVVKRIPNIKKLEIVYDGTLEESPQAYCLDNLCRLCKIESLDCFFDLEPISRSEMVQSLMLPHSLKKLGFGGTNLHWEDMGTKIGSLPHLQALKLGRSSFKGPEWETVEGQFRSLKYLKIFLCGDLECWRAESTHFPCLEHLVLCGLFKLKEVPSEIGDIPTLKSIELHQCSDSAVISAKEILKEQEDLGNEGLQVRVWLWKKNKELESLASHNFIVEITM